MVLQIERGRKDAAGVVVVHGLVHEDDSVIGGGEEVFPIDVGLSEGIRFGVDFEAKSDGVADILFHDYGGNADVNIFLEVAVTRGAIAGEGTLYGAGAAAAIVIE